MKYTSKRVYKNARKSQRTLKDSYTGGLGFGSTVKKSDNDVPVTEITTFASLQGLAVKDDTVKLKYFVDIDGDTIKFTGIDRFVSSRFKINPFKYDSFDKMNRAFYNINTKFSAFSTPQQLSKTQNGTTAPTMAQVLSGLDRFFDKTLRDGKPPTEMAYSEKQVGITYNKRKDDAKGTGRITKIMTKDKYEEQTVYYDIPKEFQSNFKTNVVNYFRKLIDPEDPGITISDAAPPSGSGPVPGSGPPSGPGSGPPSGPGSGPGSVVAPGPGPGSGSGSGPPVPQTGTPIVSNDIPEILKIIPDAKFDGTELLSKTKIIKGVDGKYYATETTYDVTCK